MRRLTCLLGLLCALSASPAAAQTAADAPGCTYHTCALRLEGGFFGPHLAAGAGGRRVPLRELVQITEGVPAAHAHALRWQTQQRRSLVLLAAAVGLLGVALVESLSEGVRTTALVAGTGAVVGSSIVLTQSRRHLNRALWHYNGTFASPSVAPPGR